jgi:hypothetical protein
LKTGIPRHYRTICIFFKIDIRLEVIDKVDFLTRNEQVKKTLWGTLGAVFKKKSPNQN